MGAPTFLELARSIDRKLDGNINFPFQAVSTSPVSILDTDYFLSIDASGGNRALTLPSAVTVKKGLGYWLMRIDASANSVTLATTGGQTINGAASVSLLLQYGSVFVVSDGANWLLFASPTAFALGTDVLWVFPGTISTDQNANLYKLHAKRAMGFVAFDAQLNVAPVGADVVIDWAINGVVDLTMRVTVPAGSVYAQTVVSKVLEVDDTLQPIVTQVGASTPGLTIVMRARGQ